MDENSTVEQLTKLLVQQPKEFDIAILRPPNEEGDPFVLLDHNLGLNAGDLARLARDFRRAYRDVRTKFVDNKNATADELLKVTACLLLLCPDHATAWADRKRALLEKNDKKIRYDELCFLNLVMTKHTKAPSSWFHRKYVLQQIMMFNFHDSEELMSLARNEIQLCIQVAERYPKNYYAWTHRTYVTQLVCQTLGQGSQQAQDLLQDEWSTIEPWLRKHVSDHSAAHFGGAILRLFLQQNMDNPHTNGICLEAIATAQQLVAAYPTHEVLWIFRRVCSHAYLSLLRSSYQTNQQQVGKQDFVAVFWDLEIVALFKSTDYLSGTDEIVSNEEKTEARLTQRYRLTYVIWVIEYLVRLHRRHDGFLSWLSLEEIIVQKIRSQALVWLQQIESMPYLIFRS